MFVLTDTLRLYSLIIKQKRRISALNRISEVAVSIRSSANKIIFIDHHCLSAFLALGFCFLFYQHRSTYTLKMGDKLRSRLIPRLVSIQFALTPCPVSINILVLMYEPSEGINDKKGSMLMSCHQKAGK